MSQAVRDIEERGYTILDRVIEPEVLDEIDRQLLKLERDLGVVPASNEFEGTKTVRIYNLLAHDPVFQRIPVCQAVLDVVEGVLEKGCLISSLSSIAIDPGETPQLLHSDDQVIALPRPHPPLVCNTMWALSDFTEENGATRIVPNSHRLDHYPDPSASYETIPAAMERGSVLVWHGSLWHGGGANRSDSRRTGIAMNYCAGFIRQQENVQLGIPREIAASFSSELQRLVGYGVFRGLIGHIDKRDPIELLGGSEELRVIWDR
jgi:ectoine hydroxylase-related dioxygenase (phytanoyl-CoA dioxygenase family)